MADVKARILVRLKELDVEDRNTASDRATVTLDQQSVGRLSRMDALQQQAMANATHQRRQNERTRLNSTLKRLEQDEYGYCLDCGEDIDPKRLELDPTVIRCITCAKQL